MNNKIGRNDLCPCGSGKKFKNCCLNRTNNNDMFKNYKGDIVDYDKDKNDKLFEEINELAKSKLFINRYQAKRLTANEGVNGIQECYQIIDNALEDFYQYSTCKEGCNYCCCEIVETSPLEAEYIRSYINGHFDENQKCILKGKIDEVIKVTPTYKDILRNEMLKYDFYKKKIPCIFLDDSGKCLIYNARPFNCRKLLVFSEASKCNNSTSTRVEYAGQIINNSEHLVRQASINCYENKFYTTTGIEHIFIYKPLPYWFINGFEDIDLQK